MDMTGIKLTTDWLIGLKIQETRAAARSLWLTAAIWATSQHHPRPWLIPLSTFETLIVLAGVAPEDHDEAIADLVAVKLAEPFHDKDTGELTGYFIIPAGLA